MLRDADVMLAELKKDSLKFEAVYFGGNGEQRRMLRLPKLECLTLVTGYSVELRYRITGLPLELEAQASASWFRRSLAARQLVPLTRL